MNDATEFRKAVDRQFSLRSAKAWLIAMTLLFVVLSDTMRGIYGSIEGYLFPVTGQVRLLNHDMFPPPAHKTIWTAEADKYRSCDDFVRIEWFYVNDDGGRSPVITYFVDRPQTRDTGLLAWDGLVITMSPEQTRSNSEAWVYHDCPWRFWTTRTLFYRSG